MSSSEPSAIDLVRELRLRQWARQHFVSPQSRKASWHPVVLDEMSRRDRELLNEVAGNIAAVEIPPGENSPQHELGFPEAVIDDLLQNPGSVFVPLEPVSCWQSEISDV